MMMAPIVLVTVAVETAPATPDDAARELARSLVGGMGLNVERVSIKAAPERVKAFIPKAGKPGSVVVREGRAFSVWAETPEKGGLWLVPVEPREGDAPVYRSHSGGRPIPHHSDGSACGPSWHYPDGVRTEVPCQHQSHKRSAVA